MGQKQTAKLRQEVVRVALTSGFGRKQVASDFGIGFSALCRWINEEQRVIPSKNELNCFVVTGIRDDIAIALLKQTPPTYQQFALHLLSKNRS